MSLPSSAKFDICDWTFRAVETTDPNDRTLSDDAVVYVAPEVPNPISAYATSLGNVVTADSFTTLVADAQGVVTDTVRKSSLQVSEALPFGVPESFTFEFDIFLPNEDEDTGVRQIPLDFRNPDNRLFVGAVNQQSYTAGFLFSYEGIALASYPEDPSPTVLAGSKNLLFKTDGTFIDGLNLRAIVSSGSGRIAIYVAPSDSAYGIDPDITEAVLKYNLAAKKSSGKLNDCIYLQSSAPSKLKLSSWDSEQEFEDGELSIFSFGSIRLSSSRVIPEDRPIADAYTVYQTQIGTSQTLIGAKSYDPGGKNIIYNWEFDLVPDGSNCTMQGASYATADIIIDDPNSIDPLNPDPLTAVVLTYTKPTRWANDFKVSATKGPNNSLLSMSWDTVSKVLSIVLGVDNDGEVTTTAGDLVTAFSNNLAAGYNIEISGGSTVINFSQPAAVDQDNDPSTNEVSFEEVTYPALFRADLAIAGSAGTEKLKTQEVQFSGGSGSNLMNPVIIPDKPGVYVAYLTVDNGTRESLPSRATFTAGVTSQLIGHRPNSEYVWKYLSDFWNLVPDKAQITSVWSALTQAVSSDLVTAWQNDYAKAIKDVSRRYQRRWLHYDAAIDVPTGYTATIIHPENYTVKDLDVSDVIYGSSTDTATVIEHSATAPLSVGKALLRSTLHAPKVIDLVGVIGSDTVDPTKFSWAITGSSKDTFPSFEVLAQRTGGYFTRDTSLLTQTTPAKSVVFDDPTYPLANVVDPSLDTIRVFDENDENPKLVTIAEVGPNLLANAVKLSEGTGDKQIEVQTVDGFAREWDHLREARNIEVEQSAYVKIGDELDLSQYDLSLGDYVLFCFENPYTNSEIEVPLTILGVGGQCLFVDWGPLLSGLIAQSILAGEEQFWEQKDLVSITLAPKKIVLSRKLGKATDLVSIPRLGVDTLEPEMNENLDFHIKGSRIHIQDWYHGTVRSEAGSNRVYPDSKLMVHTALSTLFNLHGNLSFIGSDPRIENVETICIGAGDAAQYQVLSYNSDGSLTLDRPLRHTAEKLYFWAPKYCSYTPGPDRFWAELSYFDNWETIQNNFGLYVGLPRDLVDEYDADVDYLTLTKAVWFAFMSGPHFDNLQLAVQSFFDLPYSEVEGQIIHIEEPTDTLNGRIIIEDKDLRSHTYFYPKGAELAINPATGNKYSLFTDVKYWELIEEVSGVYVMVDGQKIEVAESVLAEIRNAKVTMYSKLVDVVTIADYISDPDLIDRQFGGNSYTYIDEQGNTHIVDQTPTQIEKYHKFVVDVPMAVTQSTQVFPLIKTFLDDAKPAYTDFILIGSLQLTDEISVVDTPYLYPTLSLKDTPHTSPFWALNDQNVLWDNSVAQQEAHPVVPKSREDLLWPKSKTYEKVASIDYTDLLTQAIAEDLLPSGFNVTFSAGANPPITAEYRIQTGANFAYGTRVIPLQPPQPPHVLSNVNLTNLGVAWHSGAQSFGFFIGDQFHIMDRTITGHGGLPTNGAPTFMLVDFSQANAGMNLLGLEGVVDKLYLFADPAADMLNNYPPTVTYWDKEDVLEKYESGYCEGVLDDYSGDGSWNFKRKTLDMVNTLSSDIDVVRSRIMVPVLKDTTPAQEDIEFQIGEPIEVHINTTGKVDAGIWEVAPPVILHIGAGVHPKIPAWDPLKVWTGIFSPQHEHPNTYLLLGFDRSDTDELNEWDVEPLQQNYNAYGDESRLDVLTNIYDNTVWAPGMSLQIVGKWSGAIAELVPPLDEQVIRRSHEPHVSYPGQINPPEYPYFLLETIWQQDKLIEYGPASDPSLILTKYLPVDSGAGPFPNGSGGITIKSWQQSSPTFDGSYVETSAKFGGIIAAITAGGGMGPDPEVQTMHPHHLIAGDMVRIWNTDQTTIAPGTVKLNGEYAVSNVINANAFEITAPDAVEAGTFGYLGHSPEFYQLAEKHEKEVQQHPYRSSVPGNEQFIPSNSPGVYSDWQNVINTNITKLTYGYEDVGALDSMNAVNIQDFNQSPLVSAYLQNIHYGLKIRPRKDYHYTHGFTEFFIPPPAVKMIVPSSAGFDIRICGFYFCNDDPTRVRIPTSTPDSYGDPSIQQGIIGGSWVFFRSSTTGLEIPVDSYHFEQGVNPGQLVTYLGKDRDGDQHFLYGGPDQPSDGHVLELHVPDNLPEYGYYDIIVRNYRPYQMKSGGVWQYHMDEDVVPKAFYHSQDGWGVNAWGTGPFGGV